MEMSRFVACPQIAALFNSNRPQAPKDEKHEEQQ
jgi:hypothetical protein